jgi:hypothetical protein
LAIRRLAVGFKWAFTSGHDHPYGQRIGKESQPDRSGPHHHAPAPHHVARCVVFGEVKRVTLGQYVEHRAELEAALALGLESRQQNGGIITGLAPSLHVGYKHTDIKQYFKLGRALRTEATINDPKDFQPTKALPTLCRLRTIGERINTRLLCAAVELSGQLASIPLRTIATAHSNSRASSVASSTSSGSGKLSPTRLARSR